MSFKLLIIETGPFHGSAKHEFTVSRKESGRSYRRLRNGDKGWSDVRALSFSPKTTVTRQNSTETLTRFLQLSDTVQNNPDLFSFSRCQSRSRCEVPETSRAANSERSSGCRLTGAGGIPRHAYPHRQGAQGPGVCLDTPRTASWSQDQSH